MPMLNGRMWAAWAAPSGATTNKSRDMSRVKPVSIRSRQRSWIRSRLDVSDLEIIVAHHL